MCIRCLKEESIEVAKSFGKWAKITAEEYGQPFNPNLNDWMHNERDGINPLLIVLFSKK